MNILPGTPTSPISSAQRTTTLSAGNLNLLIDSLSRAFYDDPIYMFFQPHPDKRSRVCYGMIKALIGYSMHRGYLYTIPERPTAGAAIWLPPDTPLPGLFEMFQHGLARSIFHMQLKALAHIPQIERATINHRRRQAHWYLWLLGVAPEYQRQGIGHTLLQPGLEAAERAGLPCHLETLTHSNIAFYQKRGFNIMDTEHLPNGAPLWTMRRPEQKR